MENKEITLWDVILNIIFWNTIVSLIEMFIFLNPSWVAFIFCFIGNLVLFSMI